MSKLIDKDQALAALKHKDLVVHQDDDGDDHRFDFVYLDSALDALTALPAIPMDHAFTTLQQKYDALRSWADGAEIDLAEMERVVVENGMLRASLPVLETKKETT